MRCLRLHGAHDVRLDETDEPVCPPGHVKIRNMWSGICGSDLHVYHNGLSLLGSGTDPVQLGHEYSGEIVEIGSEITTLKVGQRVCVHPWVGCDKCFFCRDAIPTLCLEKNVVGLGWRAGGMAEYSTIPERNVFPLADNMSLEEGALIEPIACTWSAISRANFQKGWSALVIGAGPIGLCMILCLQAKGASAIIVSEPSEHRTATAVELGASHRVDHRSATIVEDIQQICEGVGPHVVVDCAGVQPTLDLAIHAVRGRGTIVNMAFWGKKPDLDPNSLLLKQITYMCCNAYDLHTFPTVIDAIATGQMKRPGRLITSRLPLDKAVSQGIHALDKGSEHEIKILVELSRSASPDDGVSRAK